MDAPNTNDATDQPLLGCDYRLYVDVIMHRVLQLLQHCGVGKVVMVFDGPRNAMKVCICH